ALDDVVVVAQGEKKLYYSTDGGSNFSNLKNRTCPVTCPLDGYQFTDAVVSDRGIGMFIALATASNGVFIGSGSGFNLITFSPTPLLAGKTVRSLFVDHRG